MITYLVGWRKSIPPPPPPPNELDLLAILAAAGLPFTSVSEQIDHAEPHDAGSRSWAASCSICPPNMPFASVGWTVRRSCQPRSLVVQHSRSAFDARASRRLPPHRGAAEVVI